MSLTELVIYWNPSPDAIRITDSYSIKWYGILWGLSLFSCFFLARYVFKKVGKSEDKITLIIQYVFVGGLIGARLVHIIFYNLDDYLAHPWTHITLLSFTIPVPTVLAVWEGGLASHGGVIGGLIGLYIFCRRNREFDFFWTLDHGIICVIILAALIRFGNLMNSEEVGIPASVPWAFVFAQVDAIPRHPVVLYESISYLLVQLLMLLIFNKYLESKPGIYLVLFLTLIFSIRFLLEFMKVPDGHLYFGLISTSQLLTLPFVLWRALFYHGLYPPANYITENHQHPLMAKYERWLGASLGWVTGGPIGGLLGFLAGSLIDNGKESKNKKPVGVSEFEVNLMVLASYLIKIDGRISIEEISFVNNFLNAQFEAGFEEERKQILNQCLQKEYDLNVACGQIRMYTTLGTKVQVVNFLFDLGMCDGELSERENYFIFKIAGYLNINDVEFRRIKKSLIAGASGIYEILGAQSTMSIGEIRTIYRKLVLKYHPDRNNHLPEEERKKLALKFQHIKEAYQKIKEERGE